MTRGTFWLLTLSNIPIIFFITCLIGGDIHSSFLASELKSASAWLFIVLFLFNLCIAFRRLHDTGRSGAYITLPIIIVSILAALLVDTPSTGAPIAWSAAMICLAVVSGIWYFLIGIILLCFDSEKFDNKYGHAIKYKHLTAGFTQNIYITKESTATLDTAQHIPASLLPPTKQAELSPLEQSLHQAVAQGHIDTVKLLLEQGVDRTKSDHKGITPLVIASQYGHIEIIKLLLDNKAPIHSTT